MSKLVIFDLDGTLLDTLPDLTYNVNKMLEHFNLPVVSTQNVRRFIGNGARKLVERAVGGVQDEKRFEEYFAYYNELYNSSDSSETKFFDGIPEVLSEFKKRGYKLAICTNKPQIPTENVCEQFFKEFECDKVVGLSEKVIRKPDPKATLDIIEKLGVEKENVYFIGDGETDVMTAINAGIKSVAVLWGYRDKEELQEAGAKIFAEKPLDLLELISL